jgi:hypothetical protein
VVGDSGTGKSPGADCLLRDVLPEIERRMVGDYLDRLREWQAAVEFDKIKKKGWQDELREAQEIKKPLPAMPLPTASDIAPEKPRLRQHDVTIEQVAAILATAAPKGVAMVRDEIAGWLMGMDAYNPAGRPFWLEAYGGRPYRVERRKHGTEPIEIERLAVAVYGGTQPDRLSELRPALTTACFRASSGCGPIRRRSGAARRRRMSTWRSRRSIACASSTLRRVIRRTRSLRR